mmetsp:Transcript_29335/g.49512  ORF Transcript_29335/g.49512 Transcript_29335/m.49512 type:complete len:403 (+) Transcript_29335:74-1282(+)
MSGDQSSQECANDEEVARPECRSHHDSPRHDGAEEDFLVQRNQLLFGERLIFVLDGDGEEMRNEWEAGSGKTRLEATADAIRMIIRRKLNATLSHTFAIASYNSDSQVTWWTGFTADFEALDGALGALSCVESLIQGEARGPVKLAEVFDQLSLAVAAAGDQQDQQQQAAREEAITRFVFVYSRSTQVPEYASTRPIFCAPIASTPAAVTPYLDVLFLHHKLAAHRDCAASCQETLNVLSLLQRGDSDEEAGDEHTGEENNYLFETHASNMRLMTYAALLCAHPAHREEQTDMLTKLNVNEATLQGVREVDEAARLEEVKARARQQAHPSASKKTKSRPPTVPASASTVHATSTPASSASSSPAKNIGDVAADTVKSMFGFGSKSRRTGNDGATHGNHNDSY